MYDYEVVYLGSGHACWHGALILKAAGKRVAFVDHDLTGGTCTNYGCNAKILLDSPFELLDGLERYKGLCVDDVPAVDWKANKTVFGHTVFSSIRACISPALMLLPTSMATGAASAARSSSIISILS